MKTIEELFFTFYYKYICVLEPKYMTMYGSGMGIIRQKTRYGNYCSDSFSIFFFFFFQTHHGNIIRFLAESFFSLPFTGTEFH